MADRKAFEAWKRVNDRLWRPGDDSIADRRDWMVWQGASSATARECAEICESRHPASGSFLADAIRERFGIKE